MRKVFFASGFCKSSSFKSRDFDIEGKSFSAPICYLIDENIEAGDEVLVAIADTVSEPIKKEISGILSAHSVSGEIVEIPINTERELLDSLSFSEMMKAVSDLIREGDILYADLTHGIRGYLLAMVVGLHYAARACLDVRIASVVYWQEYEDGVDIIDITALMHILSIVSDVKIGDKAKADKFFSFLIG